MLWELHSRLRQKPDDGAELIIRMLEQHGITSVSGIRAGRHCRCMMRWATAGSGISSPAMSRVRVYRTGYRPHHRQSGGVYLLKRAGATNLMTAIADAKLDSVPLVCITAQVSSPMIGTDAFQKWTLTACLSLSPNITTWCAMFRICRALSQMHSVLRNPAVRSGLGRCAERCSGRHH